MSTSKNCEDLQLLLKQYIVNDAKRPLIDGPDYIRKNRLLASLYMKDKQELDATFHLTESHAATLRQKVLWTIHVAQQRNKNSEAKFSGSVLSELHIDFFKFDNPYFQKGADGLVERLKELPHEWTVVQLTFGINPNERVFGSLKDSIPEMTTLYLTRLPCGDSINERDPVTVSIQPPVCDRSIGVKTILESIDDCIRKITLPGNKKQKFKMRQEAADEMKGLVSREIVSHWLKEWCCLMIGTLCDKSFYNRIRSVIDNVLSKLSKEERSRITKRDLTILYQIVESCAHLSDNDISKAVNYCIRDSGRICSAFLTAIRQLKEEYSHALMTAKRNPVLLILDDNLDNIPWEMLPILFRHPVSRIPSLHFAHALYDKFKDEIVDGKMIVKNTDVAFYIINPDRDMISTQQTLLKFITLRHPNWNGIEGEKPSNDQLVRCLQDYNVFMYSGHGNGAQYLSPEQVCQLNVNVVPLLFGCSSVSKKHIGCGGRNELIGVSDQFVVAGCPCLVGMLWPVLTTDTDIVTMMLLNMTMSGTPININDVIGTEMFDSDEAFCKEPELLRALKSARSAARLYTNGAALVARGIPVEFQD